MKITHVDYSILGLLANGELSGYQVRMVFEKTAMGNFSGSPGSIYPALARLHKQGLIDKKEFPQKRIELYAITKTGIRALREWILQPVTRYDVTRALEILPLRVAFLDHTDNEKKRTKFLESLHDALQEYLSELETYYKKEAANMPMGGRLALELGVTSYKATLKWVQDVQRAYGRK